MKKNGKFPPKPSGKQNPNRPDAGQLGFQREMKH